MTIYRRHKIARLVAGERPRVIDLFSGCGGLSLGFLGAGFQLIAGLDNDRAATSSYGINFRRWLPRDLGNREVAPYDLEANSPEEIWRDLFPHQSISSAVDVVIGGPPCQAFARIGRAKLRNLMNDPAAHLADTRGRLYRNYLHFVEVLQPLAVLLENVPDALSYGGENIAEKICDELERMGYLCAYTLLNSVHYGVPQMRERLYLIAVAKELGTAPTFPEPTTYFDLPRGYISARRAVLARQRRELSRYFVPPKEPSPHLPPAVTAHQALGDLPPIVEHLRSGIKAGPRQFKTLVRYRAVRPSNYARLMRSWPGFESSGGVWDHATRSLPRDYPIFRLMQEGDEYPQALRYAEQLYEDELSRRRLNGELLEAGIPELKALRKAIVPPYDPSKFPNKWWKMKRGEPVRTLMAHLGRDSYSHIHYDSSQARTLSVREAARLQSFPDGFGFAGGMNAAFKQIGNAVPPLMAYHLACRIRQALPPTAVPVPILAQRTWKTNTPRDHNFASAGS